MAGQNDRTIYVANASSAVYMDGQKVLLHKGRTRVRAGHELLKRYPDLFEELGVDFDVVETARQEPGGKRTTAAPKEPEPKGDGKGKGDGE